MQNTTEKLEFKDMYNGPTEVWDAYVDGLQAAMKSLEDAATPQLDKGTAAIAKGVHSSNFEDMYKRLSAGEDGGFAKFNSSPVTPQEFLGFSGKITLLTECSTMTALILHMEMMNIVAFLAGRVRELEDGVAKLNLEQAILANNGM